MLKQIALGIVLLAGLQVGTAWADKALNKALFDAASTSDRVMEFDPVGTMKKVEVLISKGADVNARDDFYGEVFNMKLTMKLLVLFFGVLMLANVANAESPREQLKQMVGQLQQNPDDNALREKIIKLAQKIKPAPAIPPLR